MRPIDKFQKSIKVLNDYRNKYHTESTSTEEYEVANAINDILPKFCRYITSDVAPVIHAHYYRNSAISMFPICSRCHMINAAQHSYCESCGAKMDEEQR